MIDTAALRALLAQTTQGEWIAGEFFVRAGDSDIFEYPSGSFTPFPENAAFTATTHNAMPALLDELDRLRAFVIANGWELENTGMYITSKNDETCRGCGAGRWLSTKAEQQISKPIQYDVHEDEHAPGCIVAEARAAQKEARE